MLLQTLELRTSGELHLESQTRPLRLSRALSIDTVVSGVTGATLGFVITMVGAALGSTWGHSLLTTLLLLVVASVAGCLGARREFRRGECGLADLLFNVVQAGALAGFGVALGLACDSLVVMQLAYALGVASPSLISLLPERAL